MTFAKRLPIGGSIGQFPAGTVNAHTLADLRDSAYTPDVPPPPPAIAKSPVHALLYWTGAARVPPGATVALFDVLVEPSTDASVPFYGLRYKAREFVALDDTDLFAVTLETIEPNGVGAGIVPNAWWAKVRVDDADHTQAALPTAGTLLESSATGGFKIIYKEPGLGEKWAIILIGTEKRRLIRGQSVGAQAGGTILIDNVVALAGGVNPTGGNALLQVRVSNFFAQSYVDNEWLDAVYSPGVSIAPPADWETLKTTSGTENYRLLMGNTTAAVAAGDASFEVDLVQILSGGLDPRTTPGDMAEHVTIYKPDKSVFQSGYPIVAAYDAAGDQWFLLPTERYRAIRGECVAAVAGSDADFYIDHVVPLDAGLDPRIAPTSSTEQILIINVPADDHAIHARVWADYNAQTGLWEARPKGGGAEKKRLISGQCTSAVNSGNSTFTIDNIQVLAGGLDPRTVPGDAAETLTIINSQPEYFADNEVIIAIYNAGADDWATLVVERFRRIRGTCLSNVAPTDATFLLDNIVVLESGLDPRSSPDSSGYITIQNTPEEGHVSGDVVFAYYVAKSGDWHAEFRKANDGAAGLYSVAIDSPIPAGTAALPNSGTGQVYAIGGGVSTTDIGNYTIINPFSSVASGSVACEKTYADPDDSTLDEFTITGVNPPALTCATATVVTNVGCEDGDIVGTTADITYVSGPCP